MVEDSPKGCVIRPEGPMDTEAMSATEHLVLTHANADVRERLLAHVLPEEELEAEVRNVLFSGIADWPRWKKINKVAIARKCGCDPGDVTFEKVEADTFSSDEWDKLKKLRALFPAPSQVDPFWVVATAGGSCERRYTKVSVRVTFDGKPYVREIAL